MDSITQMPGQPRVTFRFPPSDKLALAKAREPPGRARWGWTRSTQTPLSLPQWIRAFALRELLCWRRSAEAF